MTAPGSLALGSSPPRPHQAKLRWVRGQQQRHHQQLAPLEHPWPGRGTVPSCASAWRIAASRVWA